VLGKVKLQYEDYPFPVWSKRELAATVSDLQNCFKHLEISPRNKAILDVGCGTGLIAAALALIGGKVTGIDISETSIEKAKRSAENLGLTIGFECQDLFRYNSSTLFDMVFCIGVLHHTHDPYAGFRKIASLIKPSGYLVLGLYSKYSLAYHLIDVLVRNKFQDTKEGLDFVRKRKALFSLFHPGLASVHVPMLSFLDLSLLSASDEYLVDKFCHAQRSYHAIGEVKRWMRNNDIEYKGLFSDGSVAQTLMSLFFFFNLVGKNHA
jgi:SAM-dependent methyltransferase